ncbi:PhzF family phenazine biosynthesis protein [Oceanidesulfovibrio marinus]|uniref:Isomerase n=1 Tax=Oceanidesulfovibrio marinus TaxID=370038 RepID=A0A6P1ZBT9_9BACT|nr:PhzF family phenazine biosynthesis protein [Oceanidesulfovibrio marinus]QJT09664.1 PhzF family phenazine biosynthesis protein [Oceanidesulfovibrio marinus]TVM31071.1 isomerase [Oceanidesulfovibrio marinus]
MDIAIYQVDAFTSSIFGGNPAAVCPLESWLDKSMMLAIAAENNLSETAFFAPQGKDFAIRWFTPTTEVELCGHATLASAHVLISQMGYSDPVIRFHSASGPLSVEYTDDGLLALDFPAWEPGPITDGDGDVSTMVAALGGVQPVEVLAARDYLVVLENEEQVRAVAPDMQALTPLKPVIVTAPGKDRAVDFVSRVFAPSHGVAEDPVTGSAHTQLTPYWAKRLGKSTMRARQVSARGGELLCTLNGDRVSMAGDAVLYMSGTITIPG